MKGLPYRGIETADTDNDGVVAVGDPGILKSMMYLAPGPGALLASKRQTIDFMCALEA